MVQTSAQETGSGRHPLQGGEGRLAQLDHPAVDGERVRLQARGDEELRDQRLQLGRLAAESLDRDPPPVRHLAQRAVTHHRHVACDDRERGSELVSGHVQEVALGPGHRLRLGEEPRVAEGEDGLVGYQLEGHQIVEPEGRIEAPAEHQHCGDLAVEHQGDRGGVLDVRQRVVERRLHPVHLVAAADGRPPRAHSLAHQRLEGDPVAVADDVLRARDVVVVLDHGFVPVDAKQHAPVRPARVHRPHQHPADDLRRVERGADVGRHLDRGPEPLRGAAGQAQQLRPVQGQADALPELVHQEPLLGRERPRSLTVEAEDAQPAAAVRQRFAERDDPGGVDRQAALHGAGQRAQPREVGRLDRTAALDHPRRHRDLGEVVHRPLQSVRHPRRPAPSRAQPTRPD